MPRAFRTTPRHPAILYLVRLHSDLGGQIDANRREAVRLADAMRHVEAVIRLFDPTYDIRRISVRRRNRENPWYKRGYMYRAVFDVLKSASEPLPTKVIAERMLAARGVADPTPKQVQYLECGVRSCLSGNGRLAGHVRRDNLTTVARWRLIGTDRRESR